MGVLHLHPLEIEQARRFFVRQPLALQLKLKLGRQEGPRPCPVIEERSKLGLELPVPILQVATHFLVLAKH